jgi:transcriptional regulator with XRE-family HTH domain
MTTTFGELFREERKRAGKTLGQTAQHLGISLTYLSDVERNQRPPLNPERIRTAAAWFGIDPTELLAAAAERQGDFRVKTASLGPTAKAALASLQRGLPEFDESFFEKLLQLTKRQGKGK